MDKSSQIEDVILNCECGDIDGLYRIGRLFEHNYHVVYVTINNIDVVIPDPIDRSFPGTVLPELRKYPQWEKHDWKTMELRLEGDKVVVVELDREPVHFLKEHQLLPDLPRYNLFGFNKEVRLTSITTSRVYLNDKCFIAKVAPFPYMLRRIAHEVAEYHAFVDRQTVLMPRLLGYVYEEHPDRVIGFLCEAIEGKHPGPAHRPKCCEAL